MNAYRFRGPFHAALKEGEQESAARNAAADRYANKHARLISQATGYKQRADVDRIGDAMRAQHAGMLESMSDAQLRKAARAAAAHLQRIGDIAL